MGDTVPLSHSGVVCFGFVSLFHCDMIGVGFPSGVGSIQQLYVRVVCMGAEIPSDFMDYCLHFWLDCIR